MFIDTHAHLDASEFLGDADARINRAQSNGVTAIVVPAVSPANFATVRELAQQHPSVYYCLGIHPMYVDQCADEALQVLGEQLQMHRQDPKLVAVGEIGLDYFVPGLNRERQLRFFSQQLAMARELALPVVMHVRRSADHIARECRRFGIQQGIAHAFNGSFQQARVLSQLGLRLGFGGAMTYSRALQLRRLAGQLDLNSLVLETDAPDIPASWLGREYPGEPNAPEHLPRIGQELADLRGLTLDAIASATTANAIDSLPRLRRTT